MLHKTHLWLGQNFNHSELTNPIPYFALPAELWVVYYEYFGENLRVITAPHIMFDPRKPWLPVVIS